MRKRILGAWLTLAIAFICCMGFGAEVSASDIAGTPAEQFQYQYSSTYGGMELVKYLGKDSVVNIPAEIEGMPVTSIGSECFQKKKLTQVVMPDTVVSIGKRAFYWCTSLSNITWSGNLKHIKKEAFYNCDGLTTLYLPDSLTFLGEKAFGYCHSLEEVVCPDGLTELNRAFTSCGKLSSVSLPSQLTKIVEEDFEACHSLKEITIPASVVEIKEYAFYESGLEKIIFSKDSKLETIGRVAFGESNIEEITLPVSLKEMEVSAFCDCFDLKKVFFEKNAKIKKIPSYCFESCTHLEEVDIPENVTTIGAELFYESRHDRYVNVKKINIKGGKIKKLGKNAFKGLKKKGTINVPKKYKKKYTKLFQKQKWYKKTMKIVSVGKGKVS